MVEVNPLGVSESGRLLICDAKVRVDDNARFRQQALFALEDGKQREPQERAAEKEGLNYVKLEGSVGCMVNGAGLAMATMDLVKAAGLAPANFLDVGGATDAEKVRKAVLIICGDRRVEQLFVNIFGGIVRCDVIAEGLVSALREVGGRVKTVCRITGTNQKQAREIIADSGLSIQWKDSVNQAIEELKN